MSNAVEDSVAGVMNSFLNDYLSQFYEHRTYRHENSIEIKGTVKESDPGKTIVIRLLFLHENRQVAIPNIFMPEFMRGWGIGKQLISIIHRELSRFGYQLFIIDLVPSFYERLVRRGAVVCEEGEIVLITDETRLA